MTTDLETYLSMLKGRNEPGNGRYVDDFSYEVIPWENGFTEVRAMGGELVGSCSCHKLDAILLFDDKGGFAGAVGR